ncbi:SpaN/EivJ family type III secretion system needle length determinant [Serratia marcescens]|uniref:SpaN/EivJ family type III secretion system needle length determinant n=1 Tax=Serratia marcescens TaxID=615 RepID=UPI00148DA80D|nr:type III secretion system needle length determinant, SpaN/EivJ family [Serratia marcescens]QJU42321.1 hypothetical protein HMI62_24755 [Serratia marcescens]
MEEINKLHSILFFQDDIDTSICSLEEFYRLTLSRQKSDISEPEIYMGMDILWQTLTQPSLHLQISERQSITHDSLPPAIANLSMQLPEKDKVDVQFLLKEVIGSGSFDEGLTLQSTVSISGLSEISRGPVQNNNVSGRTLKFADSENESLAAQEKFDLKSRKELSFPNANRGTDVEGKIDEGGGTIGHTSIEFGSGDDNSNVPLPQKNKNMMEKIHDLLPDINDVEGESTMSSDALNGGRLIYKFKQWGEGHHVNVKLGSREDGPQLQFKPSEGLVEKRLIDLWEQKYVPANWNLQDDKGRRQRQSEPNEEELNDR